MSTAAMPATGGATTGALAGMLVRLQLKLSWRYTMSSVAMKVGSLIMALMLLASVIPAMYGLFALRGASADTRGEVLTSGFALLTLAWPITVTMMTGSNDMLDAGRFALYPVRMARLLPGLVCAAALGLGGLMMLFLGIGYVAAWSTSPVALVGAVVGWVVGFATCLASSRALAALLADVLRRRKARDLTIVLFFLVVMGFSVGSQLVTRSLAEGSMTVGAGGLLAGLSRTANIVAWTPFGWAWGIPWALAGGDTVKALVWLVLALVWLGLMAWVWAHQFGKRLTSQLEAGGEAERIVGANPLDRFLPATPAGAIAKRGLRYFRRDPRRLISIIATLLVPLLMAISMSMSMSQTPPDQQTLMLKVLTFAPSLAGWMVAIYVGWDISYDGSALATQIVTGVSGRDDRWGRVMAALMLYVPMMVVLIVAFTIYTHQWQVLPSVCGVAAMLMLSGMGIGSWIGSIWQIPQPPPGSSLVGRNGTGGAAGFGASMIGMFLPIIVTLPVVALAVLALAVNPLFGWLALLAGLGLGALILWWGVRSGGRRLDRKWPEVLAKVTWKG